MLKKWICLILIGGLLFCAAGCKEETYAIRVGNQEVSENDYYRSMRILRARYISRSEEEDSIALWTEKGTDGTLSEQFCEALQNQWIEKKLYAQQFENIGLSFSEKEEEAMTRLLAETAENAGGMSAFLKALEESAYTYEEYKTELYDAAKKNKVLNYYYNEETGVNPLMVQDFKDYYNLHYARVKYVLISKKDRNGDPLEGETLEDARRKAADALEAAERIAGTKQDLFDEVIGVYSDWTDSTGDGVVISDESGYAEELSSAVLEMNVGDVRMLENEDGF